MASPPERQQFFQVLPGLSPVGFRFSYLADTFYRSVRITVLGSGSGGNCTLLESGGTRVLVDVGFGPRSVRRRLREAGLALGKIDAVLITHGHRDHVAGLPSLVEQLQIPVFLNEGTREEVASLNGTDRQESFESGSPFAIGTFEIEAFDVPHDSAQPVGFRFSAEGMKGAFATDLGEITSSIIPFLSSCQWLVLESNHDEELLKIGPYPWELKQRVLGRRGHLSNHSSVPGPSQPSEQRAGDSLSLRFLRLG
jgi:phosphoribosyl 1,2-cyclic phosphodiesterase